MAEETSQRSVTLQALLQEGEDLRAQILACYATRHQDMPCATAQCPWCNALFAKARAINQRFDALYALEG